MAKKYIDAEKLKEKIDEVRQDWLGDSTGLEVVERGAELGATESILDSIDDIIESLQQEQPEVDLEKEIEKMWNVFIETEAGRGAFSNIARHFYELGQQDKYQQDRAEFAKLKAKEWQDGYDDGYQRGLNAGKEETK